MFRTIVFSALAACALASNSAPAPAGGATYNFAGLLTDDEPGNNSQVNPPSAHLTHSGARIGILTLTPGDVDYISVFLFENDELTVMTTPLDGDPAPFFVPDTIVSVHDDTTAILASSDDAGEDSTPSNPRGSVVRVRAEFEGIHAVRVAGFSASSAGRYLLMISRYSAGALTLEESSPNNTPEQALHLNLSLSGPLFGALELAPFGDLDYFSVDMRTNDVLSVVTTPLSDPAGFLVPDTIVSVLDSDGVTQLVTNDDDEGGEFPSFDPKTVFGSAVRFLAPHGGRFYILVEGFDGFEVGIYGLTISQTPGQPGICASDTNGDGVVNAHDLGNILGAWGPCP